MDRWASYVRAHLPPLACPPEIEAAIVEEVAGQLDAIYRTALAKGASGADARARVEEEITDWPALAEALIAARYPRSAAARTLAHDGLARIDERGASGVRLAAALRDLQHAGRALAASPMFTLTSAITLALSIGAATAVFALVNGVLIAPFAYRDADRIVLVQQIVPEIADRYPRLGVNARSFRAFVEHCRQSCDGLIAMSPASGTLTSGGEPEALRGVRATPNVFDFLGLRFVLGGSFTAADDEPKAEPVVVLSRAVWMRRFGSDPAMVGKTVELDGRPARVVGVLDDNIAFPSLDDLSEVKTEVGARADYFRPLNWSNDLRQSWGEYDNRVLARLKPQVSDARLVTELDAITTAEFRDAPIHPHNAVEAFADRLLSPWRRPLLLLLAAVAAALTVACVNVANLLSGRWLGRARELAIRSAMGASTRDLLRFVAAESLVLAALGGAVGLLVAWLGTRGLTALAPAGVPRLDTVHLDPLSVAVAVVAAGACAVLCALLSSAQMVRQDAAPWLRASAHTTTGGPRAARVRRGLIFVEIAVTSALLVVGGLLVASMQQVLGIDPGFTAARVLTFDVRLPNVRYATPESRTAFVDEILSRIAAAPGVEAAGLARRLPLKGEASVDSVVPVGDPRPRFEQPVANHIQVSLDYFRAVGIRLVAGRWLTEADRGRQVALISEQTARTVWPAGDALGKRFTRSNPNRSWEVVGIVGDARLVALEKPPGLTVYAPYWSAPTFDFSLAVRTHLDPASVVGGVRRAVAALDPTLPLQRVATLDEMVEDSLATRRFQLRLMLVFAAAGVLLACLGIYSVVAAAAELRTPEFALRLALGGSRSAIVKAVLREALGPLVAGAAIGVGAGVAGASLLAALLFEVTPYEPAVLVTSSIVIVGTGLAASLIPAARAMRTDPIAVMRSV